VTRFAVWIVGEPAAGKSTIVRGLLGEGREAVNLAGQKWTLGNGWYAPGYYPNPPTHFDGADQIGMSQARAYLEQYLAMRPLSVDRGILLDGARFSTRSCFELLAKTHETAVYFVASDECAARRAARDWHPDPKWLKGAITRAERFRDFAVANGARMVPA